MGLFYTDQGDYSEGQRRADKVANWILVVIAVVGVAILGCCAGLIL